jgi:hypothetical protein
LLLYCYFCYCSLFFLLLVLVWIKTSEESYPWRRPHGNWKSYPSYKIREFQV